MYRPVLATVADLAWACAVLRAPDPTLLSWLRRALAVHLEKMNWSCLRQVQQLIITLELDARRRRLTVAYRTPAAVAAQS